MGKKIRHTCTAAKGSLKCRACAMGGPPPPPLPWWMALIEKGRVLVQAYLSAEAAAALDAMGDTRTAALERLVMAEAKRAKRRQRATP